MLNNMKYFLHTFLFSDTALKYATTSGSSEKFKTPLIGTDGEAVTSYNPSKVQEQSLLGFPMTKEHQSNNGASIRLGTGSTVKTTDETYCLENEVTTSFTLNSVLSSVDFPNGKVRLLLTVNYTNNTDKEITINEVGLGYNNSSYASSWTYHRVLLDRKSVADGNFTPITVAPGESKIFVYAIEI